MTAPATDGQEPAVDEELPPRREGGPISDYGAVLFLLVLFLLALGLMYLIGRGR